jgi:hypothetical protein
LTAQTPTRSGDEIEIRVVSKAPRFTWNGFAGSRSSTAVLEPALAQRLARHLVKRAHDEVSARLPEDVVIAEPGHADSVHRPGLSGLDLGR